MWRFFWKKYFTSHNLTLITENILPYCNGYVKYYVVCLSINNLSIKSVCLPFRDLILLCLLAPPTPIPLDGTLHTQQLRISQKSVNITRKLLKYYGLLSFTDSVSNGVQPFYRRSQSTVAGRQRSNADRRTFA